MKIYYHKSVEIVLIVLTLGFAADAIELFQNSWPRVDYVSLLIAIAKPGILCSLSIIIHKKREKTEQVERDSRAIQVFRDVLSGRIRSFAVFLRPFYTTGKLNTYGADTGDDLPQERFSLERQLILALHKNIELVALGRPGETVGVGRILADEDAWQEAASQLMRDCNLIVCVPSMRPGSRWELDEIIRNKYLSKTVFLMPEEPGYWPVKWKMLRQDWKSVVGYMAKKGIEFPEYVSSGLLFSFDSSGLCSRAALTLESPGQLWKSITRLVATLAIG